MTKMIIYQNADTGYEFVLEVSAHDPEKGTAAQILRRDAAGNALILMHYTCLPPIPKEKPTD